MEKKIEKTFIEDLIRTLLLPKEEFLVSVKVSPHNDIVVWIDSFSGLSIHRLGELSRAINERLNQDDSDYSLEVSSPGLGSPFQCIEQYRKHLHSPVSVVLFDGMKHDGELLSVDEDFISLSIEKIIPAFTDEKGKKHKKCVSEETLKLPFNQIKETSYRFEK